MRTGPLIVVLAGLAQSAAAAAPTISKNELRSDPPVVTDKRLRDAIWGMFEHPDYRREKPPKNRISDLSLQTNIQTTHVPGLCRYDSVRIEFDPVEPGGHGPDAQTRPVGLTSTSWFTFVSPPKDDYESIVDYSRKRPRSDCARVHGDEPFFTAENERDATFGYRAFVALQEAIRRGQQFELSCRLYPVDTQPCTTVIAALKPEEIASVGSCDSESGALCHRISVGNRSIDVTTTGYVSPGPPPGQIVKAKLTSLIIMAHERID